jgi:DNA-3-methyladenine glycosylase
VAEPAGPPPVLQEDFYARPVLAVARDLLGATVWHGQVGIRLTEVEAYAGRGDPASHAARGPTPRSEVMFGRPGRAYVYFVYGMHWCLNLVCEPVGSAAAVLVRAGEVVAGREAARQRAPRLTDRNLARGPGRLARALGVDGALTGTPVTGAGPITVRPGLAVAENAVRTGPRVGLRVGQEHPWRLWLAGDPTVSAQAGPSAAGARDDDLGRAGSPRRDVRPATA